MSCIAFMGSRRIGCGNLRDVARRIKETSEQAGDGPILVFDEQTSEPVELDLRGSMEEVLARLPEPAADLSQPGDMPRRVGRPRLGVVAREVTLLPRHWEWLNAQPGGASVALRKLVEHARRDSGGKDRLRRARESAYRFMSAMAGNEPGFEEATRALFAGDPLKYSRHIGDWPVDVRDHARQLAAAAFGEMW